VPDGEDDAPADMVRTAMHRIYIESLPGNLRDRILDKATKAVKEMDYQSAMTVLAAAPDVDQLTKWHLVATALVRNPEGVLHETTRELLAKVSGAREAGAPPSGPDIGVAGDPGAVASVLEEFSNERRDGGADQGGSTG
jgi:hypothetical protein